MEKNQRVKMTKGRKKTPTVSLLGIGTGGRLQRIHSIVVRMLALIGKGLLSVAV